MRLGFGVPVSGSWATPQNQVRIAMRAEELGYESLWTFQRLLFPAAPDSDRWAPAYHSVLDPIVSLAFLAGRTQRIRLGVAVVNMPFFTPVLLAKQLATIDILSAGRLDVGLGLGWAPEEYASVNVPYQHRGRRGSEFLRCLQQIWTDDPVEFEGEFYRVPAAHVWPRPVQRPHPPILVGGGAPAALRRAGTYADGWVSASRADPSTLHESFAVVRQAAEAAGRDPDRLRFVVRGAVRIRERPAADRAPMTGTVDQVRADIAAIADQGATELFVDLNFDPEIGSPDASPTDSMQRAEEALTAFAPG
jgi:probable F420-dependent oxidoreductase